MSAGPGERPAAERPRLHSAERRSAIVEQAIRLFAEKGFRGTTTRELAAACGVSEPVLYQHFATKRDLYAAIIDHKTRDGEGMFQEVTAPFLATDDDRGLFRAIARLFLEWHDEDPGYLRLFLFSALEGSELRDMFIERHSHVVFDLMCGYISRRIEAGAFRRMDPKLAARLFAGMVAHFGQDQALMGIPAERPREEVIEAMVDVFLKGIEVQ